MTVSALVSALVCSLLVLLVVVTIIIVINIIVGVVVGGGGVIVIICLWNFCIFSVSSSKAVKCEGW